MSGQHRGVRLGIKGSARTPEREKEEKTETQNPKDAN